MNNLKDLAEICKRKAINFLIRSDDEKGYMVHVHHDDEDIGKKDYTISLHYGPDLSVLLNCAILAAGDYQ